jgi:tetratricopeptide (TPR) repeat protein
VYLYVPLRAAAGPVLNWGEPNNLPRLLDALLQRQYSEKMLNADWTGKLQMLGLIARSFFDEGELLALVLGLGGLAVLSIKDRPLFVGLLLLVLLNIGLRINYIGADEMFQVRRYLISSYLALMIGAGLALNEVAHRLLARRPRAGSVVFTLVLLALAVSPWVRHGRANDQSANWVAYEAWQNALSHPEERYAIVVGGDNNLFPLWYLQMVERRRPNVVALPRVGFRSPWIIHLVEPALPAGAIAMRPEYRRADLSDPLFLSTIANLIDLHSLPFAFVFDLVTNPADQRELTALRGKVQVSHAGALSWWRPKDQPDSSANIDVWRFYQITAILDAALVRDHHTETVATDYGVYFDRLANQLEQTGDFAGAVRAEENAIRADSTNDTAMANLGSMLARRGRFADAIAWYQRAIAVNPREWRHHFNLAIIYEAAGRADEAAAQRRKAVTERRP